MATNPYPGPINTTADSHSLMVRPSLSPTMSSSSSIASSSSESEQPPPLHSSRPTSRRSRADRPRMGDRQRSSSIIVPKSRIQQAESPAYGPDDARAMSPRRNSQDLERLENGVRQSLKEQARTLQSSLAALSEKIDLVKEDHAKLESENRALQDYIGGLTRTISGHSNLGRSERKKGKR